MQVIFEQWEGEPLAPRFVCTDERRQEVTPAFNSLVDLYAWLRVNGWRQVSNYEHGNEKHSKGVSVYAKGSELI